MKLPSDLIPVWSVTFPRFVARSTGERAGSIHVQTAKAALHAIELDSGKTRWSTTHNASVVATDDAHTAIVPMRGTWGPDTLIGLSNRDGDEVWRRPLNATVRLGSRSNPTRTSLLRAGGRSWLQIGRENGVEGGSWLCPVDLETGEIGDRVPVPGAPSPLGGPDGVFSFPAGGEIAWWFDGRDVREIPLGAPVSKLTTAAGVLMSAHENQGEYRVWSLATQTELCRFAGEAAAVAALDAELAVVPLDGHAVAYEVATGRQRWRVPSGPNHRSLTFLGAYVLVCGDVMGFLVRRDTGERVTDESRCSDPRCFEDMVLWLIGHDLKRLSVK